MSRREIPHSTVRVVSFLSFPALITDIDTRSSKSFFVEKKMVSLFAISRTWYEVISIPDQAVNERFVLDTKLPKFTSGMDNIYI